MSARALASLVAASFLGLALTGCPSTNTVDVHEPIVLDEPRPIDHGDKPSPKPADAAAVAKQLAANRARHLEELHAYWMAGEFPRNLEEDTIANIFRDEDGRLCAVANMISKDGLTDLIDATAKSNNLIRLADVKDGPLYDWVLHSGFTQEEIAMIQVPYMPYEPPRQQAEVERLQSHLAEVESRLRDDTPQSLKVAARRFASAYGPKPVVAAR
ncbi:MAG: hypothetical protein U0414_13620 [Polyangiaceae bacterium]